MSVSAQPCVTLKLATSLDGRIALKTGESQWITSPQSRETVHALRGQHAVILTGIGTVLSDDPQMTVRDVKAFEGPQPACAILDRQGQLDDKARLFQADRPVLHMTVSGATSPRAAQRLELQTDKNGCPDLAEAVTWLQANGFPSVFIEAGSQIAASAIQSGCVTHLEWFRARTILGGDGLPALGALNLTNLPSGPDFRLVSISEIGGDAWERYERIER